MPTTTLDAKLSFNEVTFGFVPHGGSSYYLSRLPGEIGTFLALTGLPITGIDAKEFGLADELVHFSANYEEELEDIMNAMELPIPNAIHLTNYNNFTPWQV
jgi:enoyl-CoA hydratase